MAQGPGGLSAPATVTVTVTGVAGATITITSNQYRIGTASWTLGGNFTPKNAATITAELWDSTLTVKKGVIGTVSVPANSGSWSISGPGGAGTPVVGDVVKAISSLGATAVSTVSIRQ